MDRRNLPITTGFAADIGHDGMGPAVCHLRARVLVLEGLPFMLHVTCDQCGKELRPGEDHYVVKMEVFAAHDPAELTEADLDEDHMEAVSQMLCQMEDEGEADGPEPTSHHFRFDLCPKCRQRFLRDPMGKDAAQKFDFSEN